MTTQMEINQIDEFIFEIPKQFKKMNVPARFYANPQQIESLKSDGTLNQLINIATLPGIIKYSLALPDMHQGYGFPIGGVAAFDPKDGIISPGGVGYDINCGIRLATTKWNFKEINPHLPQIIKEIYNQIPLGTGKGSLLKISGKEFKKLIFNGIEWAIENGYATEIDAQSIEDSGTLPVDDLSGVSERAIERGILEIGSLGSGNHFIEIGKITKIFDNEIAKQFGLFPNQIVVWIHTGSRGFGHQICADFAKQFQQVANRYGIELVDRGLACAPFDSKEGKQYFYAMNAAANYAFVNRQLIMHQIGKIFDKFTKKIKKPDFRLLYDVAHNIAKLETQEIDGKKKKVLVHRKGATRAFPPNSIKGIYREIGQPILVPGSMGTESYILVAQPKASELSFASCCHGAGRQLSRSQAKKLSTGHELLNLLESKGIIVEAKSISDLPEEAPEAYKDVNAVVEVVEKLGIAKVVAKTKPIGVIKG